MKHYTYDETPIDELEPGRQYIAVNREWSAQQIDEVIARNIQTENFATFYAIKGGRICLSTGTYNLESCRRHDTFIDIRQFKHDTW